MKRKLKTLKQLVEEFPGLCFSVSGSLVGEKGFIPISREILPYLGLEIEIDHNNFLYITPHTYEIHETWLEPLPEKEEWFEVFAWYESNIRPWREDHLFRSVQEFLKTYDMKESEFHWIKLRKFEI